jgi:hypothetical protein
LYSKSNPASRQFVAQLERRLPAGSLPVYSHWQQELGRDCIDLLKEKIQRSQRIIILFDKQFIEDEWNKFCVHLIVMNNLNKAKVIPVSFLEGDIPDELLCTVHSRFDKNWEDDVESWTVLIQAVSSKITHNNPNHDIKSCCNCIIM